MNEEVLNGARAEDRIRVTYILTCAAGEDAEAKARDIALEQTVELPAECVAADIERRIVGTVEHLEAVDKAKWQAVISFDQITVGDDLPQLLNLMFGNVSLKTGILVTDLELPEPMLARFPGPQFGMDGVRGLVADGDTEVRRPLICVAAKPLGLPALELADICFHLARAGVDIIKDDHGLANQETAPFRERVERCQEAVTRANALTGGTSRYMPNVTGRLDELDSRLELVRALGCRGVLVSPMLMGLDTVRRLAQRSNLVILSHPSLAGAFFQPQHGIAPELLLGKIFRLIGSDGVIYPNVGGRFPWGPEVCEAVNRNLRAPLGSLRASFPVPAGGIDAARVPYWIEQYGLDTVFLIGSSLYQQPDLEQAARQLVEAVRRHGDERHIQGD